MPKTKCVAQLAEKFREMCRIPSNLPDLTNRPVNPPSFGSFHTVGKSYGKNFDVTNVQAISPFGDYLHRWN
jgi:hypothetical protein